MRIVLTATESIGPAIAGATLLLALGTALRRTE